MVPNDRIVPQLPRLLVTGASGNLGHWICRSAVRSWCVTGTHRQHPVSVAGIRAVQVDLTDTVALAGLFETTKPRAVIHAAAISQPVHCESRPHGTRKVNVDVPERMAAFCADLQIPFVFTSTDLVFDGLDAPYTELDAPTPICVYGRQKAEAEAAVLNAYGKALVCRLPLMIGVGPNASSCFSMQMRAGIRHGRPLRLLVDEFRTPVAYGDAAKGVLNLVGKSSGLLHLGGRSRVSRYEIGLLMAQEMGVAPTMISPLTLRSFDLGMARSPDCSLSSHAAYALGYDPRPLPEAMRQVVRSGGHDLAAE